MRATRDCRWKKFGYDAKTGGIDLGRSGIAPQQETAAVIIQSPNFFGIVEQGERRRRAGAQIRRAAGFRFHRSSFAGILEPPASADIVVGELQSFAISPSYGGPFAGIIAAKEKFLRQMPGRLVGQSVDTHGNRAFCLTYRPASSTSAAKKLRRTSAPTRRSSPSWPRCS